MHRDCICNKSRAYAHTYPALTRIFFCTITHTHIIPPSPKQPLRGSILSLMVRVTVELSYNPLSGAGRRRRRNVAVDGGPGTEQQVLSSARHNDISGPADTGTAAVELQPMVVVQNTVHKKVASSGLASNSAPAMLHPTAWVMAGIAVVAMLM